MIAGATGLVGHYLLEVVLAEPRYTRVVTLGRRASGRTHPKLVEHELEFDDLHRHLSWMTGDDIFCCLGAPLARSTPRAEYRRVDHGYVAKLAYHARQAGAQRFLLITSAGTAPHVPNFFLRVKADAEASVAVLDYPSLQVFRPSMLLGKRPDEAPRWLEKLGGVVSWVLSPLLVGPLRAYRPLRAQVLARAMVQAALQGRPGQHVHGYDEIRRLVRTSTPVAQAGV